MNIGIIPAGGLSSRFELREPKWAQLIEGRQLIVIQALKLASHCDHVHILVRQELLKFIDGYALYEALRNRVLVHSIEPTGDPLETIHHVVKKGAGQSETVILTWADQIGISSDLISETLHEMPDGSEIVIPGCIERNPYVYFDVHKGEILRVCQTNEGDPITRIAFRDVGLFVFRDGSLPKFIDMGLERSLGFLKLFQDVQNELSVCLLNIARTEHTIGINSLADLEEWKSVKNIFV